MRGLLLAYLVAVVVGQLYASETEAELISQSFVSDATELLTGQPVSEAVTGGYFTLARYNNGTVVVMGMGRHLMLSGNYSNLKAGTYRFQLWDGTRWLQGDLREEGPLVLEPVQGRAPGDGLICLGHDNFTGSTAGTSLEWELCCGGSFALRLDRRSGEVWGVGSSGWGVFGESSSRLESWSRLREVPLLRTMACGGDHGLGVTREGSRVGGWGWAERGQLGEPLVERSVWREMKGLPKEHGEAVQVVGGGYAHSAVVLAAGELWGWGWGEPLGRPLHDVVSPTLLARNVSSALSGGFRHLVMLSEDSLLRGVGSNMYGQI